MLHYDETLEESPELLNDSEVERPGKAEEVMWHKPEEVEKDGGGWVVVETQRKSREKPTREVESRTGRVMRMYPTLLKQGENEASLVVQEETFGIEWLKRLEEEETKRERRKAARSARG